ncbi:MAG: B12-binding domain-containing radical SAM protein [Bacteroidales bacterium]|nr:MAG: B12-binding domain-containing radical SAM protein [Bacteroidales bacterium]
MMKILLISPARDKHAYTNKGIIIPQLALFILEGLTPKEHQVKIVEEEHMTIDFEEDCDIVGISFMTSNAKRAYDISKKFKRRGKTIIMGGIHPTILPDEALQYADAVVIGEAEGVWEQVLQDIRNNKLKRRYHDPDPDLSRYIPKNFSAFKSKRVFNLFPVMTTRGCPYDCDFCCVSKIFGKKVKHIPVENVVRDIIESKAKRFIFLDDNIIGNQHYARKLFTAIKPLKIGWLAQASISFAKNTELMQLAKDSGCKGLFIGLETVVESQLKNMKKLDGKIENVRQALKKIRKMGIVIQASVIFGFDHDTSQTFRDTLKFLIKNHICSASFNILTPYPGTRIYDEFKKNGRIINDRWEYYDHHTVVFRPAKMTPLELQLGKINAKEKFYSRRSIIKRFRGNLYNPFIYLAANLGYMKLAKAEKKRIAYIESTLQGKDISDTVFLESMFTPSYQV